MIDVELLSPSLEIIGKRLLQDQVDGSILKTITRLWTLITWKVFGGYSSNYGIIIEFIKVFVLCHTQLVVQQ